MNLSTWDRKLWGVRFTSPVGDKDLIGESWNALRRSQDYEGQPAHALLFTTRAAARNWCREKQAGYATRPLWDTCRAWRFRPVRVRERVEVVE